MRGPRTPLKRANNQLVSPPLRETRAVDIGSLWAEKFVVWILIRPVPTTLSPDDKSRKTNFVPSNSMCIYTHICSISPKFSTAERFREMESFEKDRFQAAIFLSFHICWNERTNWFFIDFRHLPMHCVEVAPKSLSKTLKKFRVTGKSSSSADGLAEQWPNNR